MALKKPVKSVVDFSRMTEVDGVKAMEMLTLGHSILATDGDGYYIDPESKKLRLFSYHTPGANIYLVDIREANPRIDYILAHRWYVIQPFDVRKAMRERPNQYVGAYRFRDRWNMVGLDEGAMQAKESVYSERYADERPSYSMETVPYEVMDQCIPIEWVPSMRDWQPVLNKVD